MRRVPRFLLRVVLLPISFIQLMGRAIGRGLGKLFAPTIQKIDSSRNLSGMIDSLSSSMATQRGLPILVGTGLMLLSLVAHGIVIAGLVATDSLDRNLFWLCIPFTLMHLGILAGFTGTMLAIPLGQGYKDE